MKKKRVVKSMSKSFSDTVVVVLLVAVILASFIGSLLIYTTMTNQNSEHSASNYVEDQESFPNPSGMVSVKIVDEVEEGVVS